MVPVKWYVSIRAPATDREAPRTSLKIDTWSLAAAHKLVPTSESPVFCATGCLVPVVQAHLLVLAWHHFSRSTSGFFELRSIPVLRTILVTHESSLHSATAICYLSKCWLGNKASFWSETGPKKMQVTFRWSYWVRSVSQCSWEDQGLRFRLAGSGPSCKKIILKLDSLSIRQLNYGVLQSNCISLRLMIIWKLDRKTKSTFNQSNQLHHFPNLKKKLPNHRADLFLSPQATCLLFQFLVVTDRL